MYLPNTNSLSNEALGFPLRLVERPGVVMSAYNASIWEAEVGGAGAQGYPWLHSEF